MEPRFNLTIMIIGVIVFVGLIAGLLWFTFSRSGSLGDNLSLQAGISFVEKKYSQAPQEIKNTYEVKSATLVRKAPDQNSMQVSVGDPSAKEFTPDLTLSRWDNEVSMKIKPDVSQVSAKDKTLSFDNNKITFSTPEVDYTYYDKPDASPEGGYEFEVIYNQKPVSNIVEIPIETKNLDFYYQPPPSCQGDKCLNKQSDISTISYSAYPHNPPSRPADGKIHRVGAAFNLFRPKIIDQAGAWVWADMDIDADQGKMTITIPPDFLASASYPITVDPTISLIQALSATYPGNNLTLNVTAGDLIVVLGSSDYDITMTVSDTKGNNYLSAGRIYNNQGTYSTEAQIWYAIANGSGSDKVAVANGDDPGFSVHEYSGTVQDVNSVLDKTASATSSASTITSSSFLTTQADEVIVAIAAEETSPVTYTAGTADYTRETYVHDHAHGTEDRIVSSIGTYTASMTQGVTTYAQVILVATFKAAAASGPSCGDGTCNGSETCATCAADCGACPPGAVILKPNVIFKPGVVFRAPNAPGVAVACTTAGESYENTSGAPSTNVGIYSDWKYVGSEITIGGSARQVCKISVYLGKVGTGQNITTTLYTANATPHPDALVGTCATILAADIPVGPGWIDFTCSADIALSASTNYYILLVAGAISDSNFIEWYRNSDGSPMDIDYGPNGISWSNTTAERQGLFKLYVR